MPESDVSDDQAAFSGVWLHWRGVLSTLFEQGMLDGQVAFTGTLAIVLVNVAVSMTAGPYFC